MEKTLDQVTDQNSKLSANIAALQNQLEAQKKEVEEERETSAMFKAEAERDIKLQKQVLELFALNLIIKFWPLTDVKQHNLLGHFICMDTNRVPW